MQRICAVTGGPFETSAAEVEYCRANDVPLPVLSFPERLRQMLVFRNRPYLYHSTCAYSGKPILSCVPPERGLSVYDVELWQSDVWDARNYAQNYNFQQPFFQQFGRLFSRVPYPNLAVVLPTMENSFYTNGITSAKNCYLVFSSSFTEDCMFSYALWHSRCLVDCVFAKQCELCFDCVNITDCYNLRFSEHCQNCTDSAFLFQCYGCANCWLCTNLSHRSYCFENEQLSKTQYEKKIQEIDLGSRIAVNAQKRRFRKISAAAPIKVYYGAENLNSSGNHIRNTRNCRNCFFVTNSEDLTDCIYLDRAKSSIAHAHFGTDTELIYNSVTAGDSVYNLRFCAECWQGSRDLEYCILCCYGCSHCFGCTGLRKASYCILNRQYTKDEYFALLPRVKAHMRSTGEYGSFFPAELSPFYYNNSEVNAFFPLPPDEAAKRGLRWNKQEELQADPAQVTALPDHICDVDDAICTKTLLSAQSRKAFRIIKAELDFYRTHRLAPPGQTPLERIHEKLSFFRIPPLSAGRCAKCGTAFQTAYETGPHPVFCETCFRDAVFA